MQQLFYICLSCIYVFFKVRQKYRRSLGGKKTLQPKLTLFFWNSEKFADQNKLVFFCNYRLSDREYVKPS